MVKSDTEEQVYPFFFGNSIQLVKAEFKESL